MKDGLPPQVQLMQFILAKWISKPIYIAAELGIADLLAQGPESIDELARLTGAHRPSLYRVMRALASVGIFSEGKNQHFDLTPMASLLRRGFLRAAALTFNAEWNDKAWMRLLQGVKKGSTPFQEAYGMPFSDWLERNPDPAELLSQANAVKAAQWHRAIVEVYDFSVFRTLTDVGGGYGALLVEILAAYTSLRGVVADLAAVLPGARNTIEESGIEDRCTVAECDFFKAIPAGSDAYLLSHVLHDWPEERAKCILENCRRAMGPGSKLLIVEMVVPPGNEPSVAKLLDLEMLVITGGRERTEGEFRALLDTAGFVLHRIVPTDQGICILESIPG
jgi:SAM-dependent methyltransferase